MTDGVTSIGVAASVEAVYLLKFQRCLCRFQLYRKVPATQIYYNLIYLFIQDEGEERGSSVLMISKSVWSESHLTKEPLEAGL